jgi:hypothetical protein
MTPSQALRAQWLRCHALLADRCGGSAGIVKGPGMSSHARLLTHRLPVEPPSASAEAGTWCKQAHGNARNFHRG